MSNPPDLPRPPLQKPQRAVSWGLRILRLVLLPFRLIGYLGLLVVIVGFTAVFGFPALGLCQSHGPGIACQNDTLQSLANFGFSVVHLSVFTGIPLILALIGLIFFSLDIGRWLHRRLN